MCWGWTTIIRKGAHTEDILTVIIVQGGSFFRSIPSCLPCRVKKEKRVEERLANPTKMDGRD